MDAICFELDKMAIKIKGEEDPMVKRVALVSSNGDQELADLIAQVHLRIGPEGTVSI